jgi:hypothetical protein
MFGHMPVLAMSGQVIAGNITLGYFRPSLSSIVQVWSG